MMMRAYNDMYLDDVMSCMGAMLDYAVNSCGEDLNLFWARFLRCGIPGQIERGNPRYLGGISGIEMACLAASRTGYPLKDAHSFIDMGSPEYWTGWAMAYIQWYLCKDFRTLQRSGVSIEALYSRYSTLHEAPLSKAVSFASKAVEASNKTRNTMKEMRKNVHLTQAQLAQETGLSLRAIRAYEQSRLDLSNASAGAVVRLSRALGCLPEELID